MAEQMSLLKIKHIQILIKSVALSSFCSPYSAAITFASNHQQQDKLYDMRPMRLQVHSSR